MEYLVLGITLAVGFLIGLIVGIFVGVERMRKAVEAQSVGHLRIDRSEPDEPPKPFLEATVPIEVLSQQKIAVLKIVNENYLSHD